MFQQTINSTIAAGIPGELAFDGPLRATPGFIDAAAVAANCVLGRYFTKNRVSGFYGPGGDTGTNVDLILGGIAGTPKEQIAYGTLGAPLAPSLAVKPGSLVTFFEMGMVWVRLAAPCKQGDIAVYTIATGVISTVPPESIGTLPVTQLRVPNAVVYRVAADAAGDVACIKLTN